MLLMCCKLTGKCRRDMLHKMYVQCEPLYEHLEVDSRAHCLDTVLFSAAQHPGQSAHLDIASSIKSIQLVDNFKHGALYFIVTTSTIIKAGTCTASSSSWTWL